jgi:hypothetical protein
MGDRSTVVIHTTTDDAERFRALGFYAAAG